MKKTLATVACALALIMSVPVIGSNTKLGQIGVDVVSAATGDTTPPKTDTKPSTPTKTTTSTKTSTSTKTTTSVQTSSGVKRLLAFGSYGGDVKLVQTKLNENGYKLKVDGIYGKLTQAAVKSYQSKNGLKADGIVGPKTLAKLMPAKPATTKADTAKVETAIKLGKAEYAAHGTKCFTVAIVAMAGDKIADVIIDDYQVMAKDGTVAVPNSDADFGTSIVDPTKVLASKLANADSYSKSMKEKGGATLTVNQNLNAIQAFATGKTIAQLEAILKTNSKDPKVDAVTSATLADTNGYLAAIIQAAKNATGNRAIKVDAAALKTLNLGKVEAKAHGTKCYTLATVAIAGGKIVGAMIDDYQVMAKDGTVAVPNSDADFGKNFPAGKVLASKLANAASYTKSMQEKGGATLTVNQNFNGIETFVIGKTIAELDAVIKTNNSDPKVDAVTSATLADTNGYLNALAGAAKEASGKIVTHKGDLTISTANYSLIDTKVEGNIIFTTQAAKDTFQMNNGSSVTGSKILAQVDAVTTASIVDNAAAFEKAISKDGTWIPAIVRDLTINKELVLEGEFKNTKTPPVTMRKIALYSQDEKRNVTRRFTLTAPKLTIKSPNANISKGIFVGDIYVTTNDFQLIDTKVVGNIYFTTQAAKDGFKLDATSSVTGKQEVIK